MDNFKIDVTGDDKESLGLALEIACRHCPGGSASAYGVSKGQLILFWSTPSESDVQKMDKFGEFPTMMDAEALTELCWKWLAENRHLRDDHDSFIEGCDGDTEPGWRVYCESWGRVMSIWYSFLAIQPITAYYGK